jgi:outer membrane protein OmpA-like peptidoglycan-associated protein
MKSCRIHFVMLLALALLTACSTAPKKDLALERVRAQLEQLKADNDLAGYAPLALGEAERSLRNAEQATGNENYRVHLIYMAERRIQIARAMAQREQLLLETDVLENERTEMIIKASRLEAAQAREEAERAMLQSAATAEDASRAREEAERALNQEAESARSAEMAREEADQARRLAESRASEAELARREAELLNQQAESLRRQLENLQLRETESGVVITLGDVLFRSNESELREDARSSLVEVVDLLQTEPDKKIRIEGHTDSVGNAEFNLKLSESRANSVRDALIDLGVSAERVTAIGLGEDFPISSNDTEEGRSRNRRVDVILLDQQ